MTSPNPELQLIPDAYSPDWIERLDGRTKLAQAITSRLQALVTDCGGDLSYMRYSICKRTVFLEAVIEQQEAAIARGAEVDQGKLTQAVNTLVGCLKTLGLERRIRKVDAGEYLKRFDKREAAAVGD